MGVDQNKGIWAATIADQPRINRDPNGVNRGRVLSYPTVFCEGNRLNNIATYHSNFETWREPGPTQVGLTIADQSRTNGGFHRHFLKIRLIWVVRLPTLLFRFFFAIGYHRTQCLNIPVTIDSSSSKVDYYTTYLSQSRTNRRSIATQGFTIADVEIHMPFHNS